MFSITESEVSVDLLDSQVSQVWMSEEVFATVREVKERIWIVWVLSLVRLLPGNADAPWRYKVGWRIRDWLRAPNDVEIQQPVMSHTETDRSAFEEFLDTAAITFQIIPFLRFTCVLTPVDGIKSATFWAGGLIRTSCE